MANLRQTFFDAIGANNQAATSPSVEPSIVSAKLRPTNGSARATLNGGLSAVLDRHVVNTENAKQSSPVKRNGVKSVDSKSVYRPQRSFVDHLPWVESLHGQDAILLQDNRSVGAVFEVKPRGTEGRSEGFLSGVRDNLEDALQDVFDEHDHGSWVVQTYTFNVPELTAFVEQIRGYVHERARGSEYTEEYLRLLQQHYTAVCKPGGLFFDEEVTKTQWSGTLQRTYVVVYRRYPASYKLDDYDPDSTPLSRLNDVCEKLFNALSPAGVTHRRINGKEFHFWMTRWFNAYSDITPDSPVDFTKLLQADDEDLPFGDQFSESMFYCCPRSDHEHNAWWFDQTTSRCISVDGIRKRPSIGHATGETKNGDAINSMMDQLPEGTVMVSTIVFVPQDTVESHIDAIAKAAIGDASDSARTKLDCATAKDIMGKRHKMYRASYAFYVNATSIEDLNRITNQARSVLLRHGFRAIAPRDDVCALDNYLLHLPMVYNPDLDRQNGWRHAQLTWVQHIANISPFLGRAVGTGNPGIVQFNRGGEPLVFDPLNKNDRRKNAHMLLFGPTGAGKSATLAGILTHVMAVYRPRMFLIEAGNSLGLTAEWFRSLGVSVNIASLKPGSGVTLPTFADAQLILDTDAAHKDLDEDAFGIEVAEDEDDEIDRDILGEMEIIATLMITGGEEKEVALLRRSDRRVIRDAIILAAQTAREQGVVTLTEHVRDAFYTLARSEDRPAAALQRIREMGDSLGLFCDGFAGEVFNRPGTVWPEVDVTLIDLAHFARAGYEPHLAISVISLLNTINNIAERDQYQSREIIVAIDEAHIITTNPLLSPFLVTIVKMWRKLGAWLWLATQNLDDFPDNAKKLLNMIEWWICLVMPREEVEQVKRFKQLNAEQEEMLLSASKAERQYTEGVVLAKNMDVLFRAVPPSLVLTLAMTEKYEKAERYKLMVDHGITEIEAAKRVAAAIDKSRGLGAAG